MDLEPYFRALIPAAGGFVVGLKLLPWGRVVAFISIIVLLTLAVLGAFIPLKAAFIENSRPAVWATLGVIKQAWVTVPAGTLFGLLLGLAVSHLRRSKNA